MALAYLLMSLKLPVKSCGNTWAVIDAGASTWRPKD